MGEKIEKSIEKIDLGLLQKLAKVFLGTDETTMKTIFLTMVIKTSLSISDTLSDLYLAIYLILNNHWRWGLAIIFVDYIPIWQVLLHTSTSKAWKDLKDGKEKLLTVFILVFAPFAFPILQIRWLVNLYRDKQNKNGKNNYLHQNCRVAELVSGTVESPLQFLLLVIMYIHDVVPLRWREDTTITVGLNEVNLGALPGLISIVLSSTTIINNALDISGPKSLTEKLSYASFSMNTCIFRMAGYVLPIITFREFSSVMFGLIAVSSLLAIVREDRRGFSWLTTFIAGIFIPCAVAREPQKSQYAEIKSNKQENTSKEIKEEDCQKTARRILTANIAMVSTSIILIFNVIILIVLLTSQSFKLSPDMILDPEESKQRIKKIIIFLVIPTGVLTIIGALCIKRPPKKDINRKRTTAAIMFTAVLTLSFVCLTIYKVVLGNTYHFVSVHYPR